MSSEFTATPLLAGWPFWVLELETSADNRSIERAYQKILSSLQLNIPNAQNFKTPLGLRVRDEFTLREARALLTNPDTRIVAEFWYVEPHIHGQTADVTQPNRASEDWCALLRTA